MANKNKIIFLSSTKAHSSIMPLLKSTLQNQEQIKIQNLKNISSNQIFRQKTKNQLGMQFSNQFKNIYIKNLNEVTGTLNKIQLKKGLIKKFKKASKTRSKFYLKFKKSQLNKKFILLIKKFKKIIETSILIKKIVIKYYLPIRLRYSTTEQLQRVFKFLPAGCREFFENQYNKEKNILNYLGKEKPSLVILPEINHFYDHYIFLKVAKQFDIPVWVKPFTLSGAHELKALLNTKIPKSQNYFFEAFPHWAPVIEGKRYFFPIDRAIYYEIHRQSYASDLGLLGFSSGLVTKVLFSCYFEKKYFEERTLLPPYIIKEPSYIKKLNHSKKRKPDKLKKIVFAVPPNQFSCRKKYHIILMKIFKCLNKIKKNTNTKIIFNLHPRAVLNYIEKKAVLKIGIISNNKIYNDLLNTDLFIFSASTTNMFAVTAGIPSIDFDFFKYRYSDFKKCSGTFQVQKFSEFKKLFFNLCLNQKFLFDARKKQIQSLDQIAV